MTRPGKLAQAANGNGTARAAASARPEPAAMSFLVFEDNGGAYRWNIVAGDGVTLAQSSSFASYEAAEQAARRVRDGAVSARVDAHAVATPVDLAARRDRDGDELDAERWLDEGGSFSSEAVTAWPARR